MNVALFLEIKNEYTEHLVETLTPYIYEGLTSIYKEAVRLADETNCTEKTLMIFQKLLQSINTWNQLRINDETNRIKQLSNTADYLDDLVKAVIKSNIILLVYSNSVSNIIGQSFYNSLTTATFIHRCYTECGKDAHNNPYLFFHEIDPMDYKRNQIIINTKIQEGITRAIRKILPISLILKEYLVNSVNIIPEPPKVELVGLPPAGLAGPNQPLIENLGPIDTLPRQANIDQRLASEPKLDSRLEKEVQQIIRSESTKSDRQKIQAIMNIDKILSSAEPTRPADLSARNNSAKRELSTITKRNAEYLVAPNLLEEEDNIRMNDDFMNTRLGQSDRNILAINIDDEPTEGASMSKKSVSGTSLNSRGMPGRTGPRMNPITSERIDPSKIDLIEDYGSQNGGNKRNRRLLRK
ncbi:hypothetical protein QJ857_gp0765 [Tupanvirus soda lake]|uniref:Uncharacterized protein n=2 Tax=Tupanvirus TaxID=2094720 RepID=A0A6N1NVA3_9VIRU|nr:hypothetical protein QJ857_gp0765 [Tupanvirus soda lake]QKU35283.1 hypothetical protein [Tupanvirus soda lake]